ncbi:MAG: hypothetical protein LBC73_08180 [Oscillospiraceae bacterium]|nr:hypothetical protein [Oscillospiraceae bacterium]
MQRRVLRCSLFVVLCFALVLLYGCNQNDLINDKSNDSSLDKTGIKGEEDTDIPRCLCTLM